MVEELMFKQMKCTSDLDVYDPPIPSMVCSVCIENIEYSGFNAGYGTNGYSQMGYNGYGYNNVYSNGYTNVGYSRTDITGNSYFLFHLHKTVPELECLLVVLITTRYSSCPYMCMLFNFFCFMYFI